MSSELKRFFSLLSGEIYQVEEDEIENLDQYQIPLLKSPPSNCKKCYGRMHIGYNQKLKIYEMCRKCVNKCVDFKALKSADIKVETPK
jgi:hypothetical protein